MRHVLKLRLSHILIKIHDLSLRRLRSPSNSVLCYFLGNVLGREVIPWAYRANVLFSLLLLDKVGGRFELFSDRLLKIFLLELLVLVLLELLFGELAGNIR